MYKYARYYDANVFAALTPAVQLGLSFQATQQAYGDGSKPTNLRAELGMTFFFESMDMTSNHKFCLGSAGGIAVAALLSVLLSACAAGPQCTELGECGGNPVGSWSSNDAAHPGCLDGPYFTPTTVTAAGAAFDSTLYGRPSPVAGQSPAQPTLADWCEGLVLQKDRTNILGGRVTFVFEDPAITKFSVVYNADLRLSE